MKVWQMISGRSFGVAIACVVALACSPVMAEDKADAETAPSPKYVAEKPFDGTTLDGWKVNGDPEKSGIVVGIAKLDPTDPTKLVVEPCEKEGKGELINATAHALDFYSEQTFGDGIYVIDFMVPKGSNSGIYIMGEYEVQLLDSYGRETVGPGDVGGLYGAQAPAVNASKAPGEWQRMVIYFVAPKFVDGEKVSNATFTKVTLNGETIHENVELPGVTPGGVDGKEKAAGPLMFQGNHGEVAFRGIKVCVPQEEE
jgi:hypothetical protein